MLESQEQEVTVPTLLLTICEKGPLVTARHWSAVLPQTTRCRCPPPPTQSLPEQRWQSGRLCAAGPPGVASRRSVSSLIVLVNRVDATSVPAVGP